MSESLTNQPLAHNLEAESAGLDHPVLFDHDEHREVQVYPQASKQERRVILPNLEELMVYHSGHTLASRALELEGIDWHAL